MKTPQPANAADFERLALRLLKAHWDCPTLELFGRSGERQTGIDILDMSGADPLRAAQCKLYDPRKALTPAEIRAQVEAAKTFKPPLGIYGLLTTAKVSTEAQTAIIEINREHRKLGLFEVELFMWDRIEQLLDEYPAVRDAEYMTLGGEATRQLHEGIGAINERLTAIEVSATCPRSDSSDALHSEIDEARALLQKGEFQLGRLLLQRLRTNKWHQMDERHRFRVLSNIGAAYLQDREYLKAAEMFFEAAVLQPDDVQAAENQALAYHMTLPREQALEHIRALRDRFPSSGRIASLWLMDLPASLTIEEVEKALPAESKATAEVACGLAARALSDCRFDLCVRLASRSIEQRQDWSVPRSIRARACLLQMLPSLSALPIAEREEHLRKVDLLFSDAITAAAAAHDVAIEAESLLDRSQVRILLNDIASADADIERAVLLAPGDTAVRRAVADMKLRHNQTDAAISELRALASDVKRPDVALGLAHALRDRGTPADIAEAIEVLSTILDWPDRVLPGGREYVASILLQLLVREQRWADADQVCTTAAARGISHVFLLSARARISHAKGDSAEGNRQLDDALAALPPDAPLDDVRWVAQATTDFGRYAQALPLWERVASRAVLSDDTKQLLNTAKRLGRDDVILDWCAALRSSGVLERDLVLFEVQTREEYDVEGAIAALKQYLDPNPQDKTMRLRLSLIGINRNRPEIVDARPSSMPPVGDVDARTGRAAVHVMKFGGYPDEALAYAYELLRLHFSDVDAHFAFTLNLHPIEPRPVVREFSEVAPGCAVSYLEDGELTEVWVVMEDGTNPDAARSEYAPEHPLSKALMSKKVGDRVVLAKGSISERRGTIRAIQNKYVFRYQEVLRNWQLRFPESHALESVKVVQVKNGKEEYDFSAVFASVEELHARVEQLKEIYRSQPVPIHMFGSARGKGTIESALFLAQQENVPLFCAIGSEEEREAALAALDVSNSFVVEPSAIATVLLLNLEDLLFQLPSTLLLAQGTEEELDELTREDTWFRGEGGVLTKSGDGVALVSISPAEREERRRSLQERINRLKLKCRVVSCVELARLQKERRELMIRALGQGGTESIVLASAPGRLLWTDDLRLAGFAKTEHGVKSAWTQIILHWAFGKGLISEEQLSSSVARLIGFQYSFISPTVPAIAAAARMSSWNPGRQPLSAVVDLIGSETISLRDAAILSMGLFERTYREAILDEQRRRIVTVTLDKLAARPAGIRAIEEIKRAIPAAFGLNVVGAADVIQTIDQWFQRRSVQLATRV